MTTVFIEPCDIVFFRDDLPFGAEGNQVARCQFPPRPSVIAGALRTRILVDHGIDFDAFAAGVNVPEALAREIGYVRRDGRERSLEAGTFTLAGLSLGRLGDDRPRTFYRAGRDLVAGGKRGVDLSRRCLLAPAMSVRVPGVSSSAPLVPLAIVPEMNPINGWLEGEGYARYLAGEIPEKVCQEGEVLDWDHRVGLGMELGTRTVDAGRLFSSRGAVLRPGWGFVASVEGCSLVPAAGLVRLRRRWAHGAARPMAGARA